MKRVTLIEQNEIKVVEANKKRIEVEISTKADSKITWQKSHN